MVVNGLLFMLVGIVLGSAGIGLTTWQYWAIFVLISIIYIKAKWEADNEKR